MLPSMCQDPVAAELRAGSPCSPSSPQAVLPPAGTHSILRFLPGPLLWVSGHPVLPTTVLCVGPSYPISWPPPSSRVPDAQHASAALPVQTPSMQGRKRSDIWGQQGPPGSPLPLFRSEQAAGSVPMASGEELSLLLLVLPARERPAYMLGSTTVEVCLTCNSCQIPSSFGLGFSKAHLSIL